MELDFKIINELCIEHGDSFYLLDSDKFKTNFRELLNSFKSFYSNTIIGYSYKTNYTPFLCSIINDLGGYAEVVSEMEYDLAIKTGIDPGKIIINGPYKTRVSLMKYFKNGSLINLDSSYEVDLIKSISNEIEDCSFRIGLRCNFNISDKYISRFGFDIESKDFIDLFHELSNIRNIEIEGIHCHFPDRILDLYEVRVNKMFEIAKNLFKNPPKFIDIGGGYFGKMPEFLASQFNCTIPTYIDYARVVAGAFDSFYKDTPDIQKPKLIIEPGSAIVADVLKFVAKVIDIKNISNKHIAMTAGSKFNMGAFASSLNMPMDVYIDPSHSNQYYESIDISGYTCIENDYLFKNFRGLLGKNAFVVFSNVGSYSVVFKPPFILPNAPIIELINYTTNKIIKRKENVEDIFTTYNFFN